MSLLDDAKRDLDSAARKAENLRRQYNAAVAEWQKAKLRWQKLSEAKMMADHEQAVLAQRRARGRG